jgi:hypothetical protein
MPFDIASGTSSAAEALQPVDASNSPGVQAPTATAGQLAGPTAPGLDTTTMFQEQMAAGEADARAAQQAGMDARNAMLGHYEAAMTNSGPGEYGDLMDLPLVPDTATPAVQSDLYPYAGMEPTPAAAGFNVGNEPTLPE